MNFSELLEALQKHNITVGSNNEKLLIQNNGNAIPENILAGLKLYKSSLLEYLNANVVKQSLARLPAGATSVAPTEQQRQMFFIEEMAGHSSQYNISNAFEVPADLNFDAFKRAIMQLLKRHTILITPIKHNVHKPEFVFLSDSEIEQRAQSALKIEVVNRIGNFGDIAALESQQTIPLMYNALSRFRLIYEKDVPKLFMMTVHHIVLDGRSLELLLSELLSLYKRNCQQTQTQYVVLDDKTNYTFFDYCYSLATEEKQDKREQSREFWQACLEEVPPLSGFTADMNRPEDSVTGAGSVQLHLAPDLTKAISVWCQSNEVTAFMVFMAALALFYSRYEDRDDICFGFPSLGRNTPELEGVIGYLAKFLPMRHNVEADTSFGDMVQQVKFELLQILENEAVSFSEIVDLVKPERISNVNPIVQTTLSVTEIMPGTVAQNDEQLFRPVKREQFQIKFDVELTVELCGDSGVLNWNFNKQLYHESQMEQAAQVYLVFLENLLQQPNCPLNDLSLGVPSTQIGDDNSAAEVAPDILKHFARQVAEHPEHIAIRHGIDTLSYQQLDRDAEALAAALKGMQVMAGHRVGINLPRNMDLFIAMLAVIKLHAIYIPLDYEAPQERVLKIIEAADLDIVLGDSASQLAETPKFVDYHNISRLFYSLSSNFPRYAEPADRSAYIIFTSGTTGTPKGVEVTVSNIVNLVCNDSFVDFAQVNTIAQASNPAFDATTFEFWGSILNGKEMVILDKEKLLDPSQLKAALQDYEIDTLFLSTALLNNSVIHQEDCFQSLTWLLFGGEKVTVPMIKKLLEKGPPKYLRHVYGPTECTTFSTYYPVTLETLQWGITIPIGKAVSGAQLHVLNENLQYQPCSAVGELCISGLGVAKGYFNIPESENNSFVQHPVTGQRLYRTGDMVRKLTDGNIEFIRRKDSQVKLRGFRIEPQEIVNHLLNVDSVSNAFVKDCTTANGTRQLVAWFEASSNPPTPMAFVKHLKPKVPSYMIPAAFIHVPQLPLNRNGKIDARSLPHAQTEHFPKAEETISYIPTGNVSELVKKSWESTLERSNIGLNDNFFEVGGNSLLSLNLQKTLEMQLDNKILITDIFKYPTIGSFSQFLESQLAFHYNSATDTEQSAQADNSADSSGDIAVIGMACKVPDADSSDELWKNLLGEHEAIQQFSEDDLLAAGVSPQEFNQPGYVAKAHLLSDLDKFDAKFFGMTPKEAEITDPQVRLLLQSSYHALENAGYGDCRQPQDIGVFVGCNNSAYFYQNLLSNPQLMEDMGTRAIMNANDKDFVATKLSYKLNLQGPSINIGTACSSSLVAVYQACTNIRAGHCYMALAGGVSISRLGKSGYQFQTGGINSGDGHCFPFDSRATGTRGGSGVGVIILKSLKQAVADGDNVIAVIKGGAVNNDAADRVGFTATGVSGQVNTIHKALQDAGVEAESIGYIETHGTGTRIGDPIEISALSQSYHSGVIKLGALKANIGHLDHAAGVLGLIKTCQVLKHQIFPPSINFVSPNPAIDFSKTPFEFNSKQKAWDTQKTRRAAVSSFGLGGTNAHLILEEAPETTGEASSSASLPGNHFFPVSAQSEWSLKQQIESLRLYCEELKPELTVLSDALQTGRQAFDYRTCFVTSDLVQLQQQLTEWHGSFVCSKHASNLVLMFPGQGLQTWGMARELSKEFPLFAQYVKQCCELFKQVIPYDLETVLLQEEDTTSEIDINDTSWAQPLLFTIEYSLGRYLLDLGLKPVALLGHSVGEVVAVCLAGGLTLKDAVTLIAHRSQLMAKAPKGAMLSVLAEAEDFAVCQQFANTGAFNSPQNQVFTGTLADISKLSEYAAKKGFTSRILKTSSGFHSDLMKDAAKQLLENIAELEQKPLKIPVFSNLTGEMLVTGTCLNADYWVKHMRQPVLFQQCIENMQLQLKPVCVEVGPGNSLTRMVRQCGLQQALQTGLTSESLKLCLSGIWQSGTLLQWLQLPRAEQVHKLPLPGYAFEKNRYWIAPGRSQGLPSVDNHLASGYLADWAPQACTLTLAGKAGLLESPGIVIMESPQQLDTIAASLTEHSDVYVLGQEGLLTEQNLASKSINCQQFASVEALLGKMEAQYQNGEFPQNIIYLAKSQPSLDGVVGDHNLRVERGYQLFIEVLKFLQGTPLKHCQFVLFSTSGQQVFLNEPLDPFLALYHASLASISKETDVITPWCIDVPEELQTEVLKKLQTTVPPQGKDNDLLVAWRQGRFYRKRFAKCELPDATQESYVAADKNYLITGGVSGIGLAFAEVLAVAKCKSVILVARHISDLTQNSHSEKNPDLRIRRLKKLQASGTQVVFLEADVSNAESLQTAISSLPTQLQQIHGIVHSAGVASGGLSTGRSWPEVKQVLAPKVAGTVNLMSVLKEQNLDFFIMNSSLASVLGIAGQFDYCAANAFQDALASISHSNITRTMSINWESWLESGMAARNSGQSLLGHQEPLHKFGLDDQQGKQIIRQLLQLNESQILISCKDIQQRLAQQITLSSLKKQMENEAQNQFYSGQALDNSEQSEISQKLCHMWRTLLGIEKIEVDYNFFELGGDSLLTLRLNSMISKNFGVELSIVEVLSANTIAALESVITGKLIEKNRAQVVTWDDTDDIEEGTI